MGLPLPSRTTPADQVRALMSRKDAIESELEAQVSILKANSSTLNSPLLDSEGFPRSDIDVWAVRHARVRIIELRNDLTALIDEIAIALQAVHAPVLATIQASQDEAAQALGSPGEGSSHLQPFAKVNGVSPGSPAAAAVRPSVLHAFHIDSKILNGSALQGLLREDLILSFGPLSRRDFENSSLTPLSTLVASHENVN